MSPMTLWGPDEDPVDLVDGIPACLGDGMFGMGLSMHSIPLCGGTNLVLFEKCVVARAIVPPPPCASPHALSLIAPQCRRRSIWRAAQQADSTQPV